MGSEYSLTGALSGLKKYRRRCLVAHRATLPHKWPTPPPERGRGQNLRFWAQGSFRSCCIHHRAASRFAGPGFEFQISGPRFRVPGSRVPGFGFRTAGFRFQVSGPGFRDPGSGSRVPGPGFRVPGFGLRGSGAPEREGSVGLGIRVLLDRFPPRLSLPAPSNPKPSRT